VERFDTAIIGAGPFGLSIAAHLSRILGIIMFGEPMRTWRTLMPPDMVLRSEWDNTNLSAPGGAGTLEAALATTDVQQKLDLAGCDAKSAPLQAFADIIKADVALWAKVVKEAGITAD